MREFKLREHKEEVEKLLRYLPWLEKKSGSSVSSLYKGENLSTSTISFPVYDSTLLSFVDEASKTGLMDENYLYVYSGYSIRNSEDEKKLISEATITEADTLAAILSKYVLEGRTKGLVWTKGVEEGIFLLLLKKMKNLLEIWDGPLA